MTIEEYKAAILKAMLEIKDVDGLAKITESDAKELLNELTDSELEDGILFNTPEEVAELLMSVYMNSGKVDCFAHRKCHVCAS